MISLLLLMLAVMTPVSMATQTAPSGNRADTTHDYVTAYSCNLYVSPSTSDPVVCTVSTGKAVHGINGTNSSWQYNNNLTYVSYNSSYYGYAQNKKIVPMTYSYKVTTATYIYASASTTGGTIPGYQSTMPVGTILYVVSSYGDFHHAYCYVNNVRYYGYVLRSNTARTYGS